MTAERATGSAPVISVVVATLNRNTSLLRLVDQLSTQTIAPSTFEVIIVDDGSTSPVAADIERVRPAIRLTVLRSERSGAAAARHRGIVAASGDIIVIVDDDIQVRPDFLARHLEQHPARSRNVVQGWIRPDRSMDMPIFERFHADVLERFAADARHGRLELQGTHLATGNVSFRRRDYLAVGGFDPAFAHSEDAELGIRLLKTGVAFRFAEHAVVTHSSDHASLPGWMRRAFIYGVCDLQIARKHRDVVNANPWRYLWSVHPVSRLMLALSVVAPSVMHLVAQLGVRIAALIDRAGAARVAIRATTVVYGIQYFRGVRHGSGSLRAAIAGCRGYVHERHGFDRAVNHG